MEGEPLDGRQRRRAWSRRSARGDTRAFAELIRRHEQPLATLIRYRIDNRDDAEDVLQETLVDAWTGMSVLRDPESCTVRGSLQVARNRCRDYYRSKHRRESPTESIELETQVNRLVPGLARHAALREDVLGALRAVPSNERAAAELFYLQGFTISEIAERHRCPEGTIKRRLFSARERLREALDVTPKRSST